MLASTRILDAGRLAGRVFGRLGLRTGTDIGELAKGHASLADADARAAFVHTLRTIVDPGGQRVDASDRLYLAKNIPFMLVWGEQDPIIPVAHAYKAHELVASSRLEIFANAGHFPHVDDPQRFLDVLLDFIESTEPAAVDATAWQEMLKGGS